MLSAPALAKRDCIDSFVSGVADMTLVGPVWFCLAPLFKTVAVNSGCARAWACYGKWFLCSISLHTDIAVFAVIFED